MLLPWELKPTFNFDFLYNHYRDFLSSIINEMLKFKNLPDTVSEYYLKHCLFDLGKVVFFRENSGEIRALNGNYSGSPDIYYLPEDIIVENPRLTKSYNLKRDKDCVIVYCTDSDVYTSWDNPPGCGGGLSSLIIKTATMLADNDLSLNIAQKNTRLNNVLGADTQKAKESIDDVFERMYAGEPYIAVSTQFMSTLQSVPITASSSTNSYIVQLIEARQYILAHFYEQIGLSTHDNLKKERLIVAEVQDNPCLEAFNIDNIITSVKDGIEKVNDMFDLSIEVELNPILIKATDQTEEPTEEDQTEEPTEEDQTEEPTEEDQTEEPTEEDQTEDININIEGDNNIIIIGGDDDEHDSNRPTASEDVGGDNSSD